jgi:hypothetical protein
MPSPNTSCSVDLVLRCPFGTLWLNNVTEDNRSLIGNFITCLATNDVTMLTINLHIADSLKMSAHWEGISQSDVLVPVFPVERLKKLKRAARN